MIKTGMRDYSFKLLAGVAQRRDVDGDYFLIRRSEDEVELNFDDSGYIMSCVASEGMPVRNYGKVELKSAVDQTVIIALGFTGGAVTPVTGRTKFEGVVNASVDFATQRPTEDDVVIPAGDTMEVLPFDASRLGALVQLAESDPDLMVRVGDSSVSPTRGARVFSDDSAACSGSAPVFVHNPNAVDVTVALYTERAP